MRSKAPVAAVQLANDMVQRMFVPPTQANVWKQIVDNFRNQANSEKPILAAALV